MCVNNCVKIGAVGFLLFLGAPSFSQVVINEVHVQPLPDTSGAPTDYLGSCIDTTYGAEWVEIYNSSLCDTVDLDCYLLGYKTADTNFVTFACIEYQFCHRIIVDIHYFRKSLRSSGQVNRRDNSTAPSW